MKVIDLLTLYTKNIKFSKLKGDRYEKHLSFIIRGNIIFNGL